MFSGWEFKLDNPTLLGWSVVAVYLLGAAACARAGGRAQSTGGAPMWWILAAGLLFLGVNKQLNLQTLMIVMGRNLAAAQGWSDNRRAVQLIFSLVFGLGLFGLLAWFGWSSRGFFSHHQPALAGTIVLILFVILRAATINHTDTFLRVALQDGHWAWVLEMTGSALIAAAALKQAPDKK